VTDGRRAELVLWNLYVDWYWLSNWWNAFCVAVDDGHKSQVFYKQILRRIFENNNEGTDKGGKCSYRAVGDGKCIYTTARKI
jgi:hypothetical protein